MSYRGGYYRSRYSRSPGSERAREHIRQANELSRKYGEAFTQIRRTFLNLDDWQFSELLESYGALYGEGAREYAALTYPKWLSGRVQMAGQTMVRLLDLLPRFISDEEKLSLIRSLREQALKRLHRASIQVSISDRRSILSVVEQVQGMVQRVGQIELPTDFHEVAGWVSLHDAQAMSQLLAETEHYIAVQRLADLIIHLSTLPRLQVLAAEGHRLTVTTRFEIPTAQVEISFQDSFWREEEAGMAHQDDHHFLARLQDLEVEYKHKEGKLSFIDYVMRSLTPEEQGRLRLLAANEGLKLEALLKELQVKTIAARGDIDSVIDLAQRLKEQNHKGNVSSTHKTASGETRIQIESRSRPCYVATACYADPQHSDVRLLRRWRDERLIHSPAGRSIVTLYNTVSPPVARYIGRVWWISWLVRKCILEPLVKMIGPAGTF